MSHRTVIEEPLPEKTTQPLTATLKDAAGAAIPGATITAMTLTLHNRGTEDVVNGRTQVNILNQNGGSVDSAGVLTWVPTAADMAILDPTSRQEWRVALIEYSWAGGAKSWKHEIIFVVNNLAKVA